MSGALSFSTLNLLFPSVYNGTMGETPVVLDTERQERADQYARIRRRLWAINLLLNGLYLGLWAGLGWAVEVRQAITPYAADVLGSTPPWWVELILFAAILFGPWTVLTLPLDYYSGYILPHRFGLSTQSLRGWLSDMIKGAVLGMIIGTPLLIAFYSTIRFDPKSWWIWAAGGYTLVTAVLATIAPILLMPIFFKFKPLGEEHSELAERLTLLARSAGTHVRGVFTFDMSRRTRAANAALVGLGRTRRIILGDTLLSEFTLDEIETVMAHELAHHAHKDILLSLAIQTSFNFLAFYLSAVMLNWTVHQASLTRADDPAGLPFIALLLGLLSLLAMPITNAFSRWRESMADDYALEVTHKPMPFASAMTRIANQNLAEVDPERWVVLLLYSHPPLKSRIEKAQRFSSSTV
ncbi:MAG TPA: M48 family metallopeptidase [Anaerolineae bacterium]|nr:M48 family metallopeptidase [Anaerolineae bacterium]